MEKSVSGHRFTLSRQEFESGELNMLVGHSMPKIRLSAIAPVVTRLFMFQAFCKGIIQTF
jgi:hypothetical protein